MKTSFRAITYTKLFRIVFILGIAQPMAAKNLNILIFGDWGTGTIIQHRVANSMQAVCKQEGCDLALLLGDNFYPDGVTNVSDPFFEERFEKPYSPLKIPFYVTAGNHDYHGNVDAQIEYTTKSKWWNFPSRSYDFNRENIQFVAIDTNQFDAQQAENLDKVLADTAHPWKIVFGHHPIYSNGIHGNSPEMIEKLLPIICKHRAIYFAGHDHDMQLLKPDCDTRLVVSGAAAKLRPVGLSKRTLFARNEFGFTRLEVNARQARIVFYSAFTNKEIFSETITR